jgi:hypothetical protein
MGERPARCCPEDHGELNQMSDSHKARHGTNCKTWKDTVYASRSQAQARSKRKKLRGQQERARSKATVREEKA